jgi:hypothetical protein
MADVIMGIALSAGVPGGGTPPVSTYTIYAGNSARLTIKILDVNGQALDIDGCSVQYVMNQSSGGQIMRKTAQSSDQGSNTGECTVDLAAADTTPLSGLYPHFVVLTDAGGHVTTVMSGTAVFQPSGV